MTGYLDENEERAAWSGFFPPLTDERLAEIIEYHAERTARFPGGDSWQLSWLATNLQAGRESETALAAQLEILKVGFAALYESHSLVKFDTPEDIDLQRRLLEAVEPAREVLNDN